MTTTPTIRERAREEFRNLKCVNGAMYFGSVENDNCNCKTSCQNEQTYEHALEEADVFLDRLITLTQQDTKEKILAALPKEMTMDAANKSGSDAGAGYTIGHNAAIKEARTAITNLDLSV